MKYPMKINTNAELDRITSEMMQTNQHIKHL